MLNLIKPIWKTKLTVMISVYWTIIKYSVPHAFKSAWKHIKRKVK